MEGSLCFCCTRGDFNRPGERHSLLLLQPGWFQQTGRARDTRCWRWQLGSLEEAVIWGEKVLLCPYISWSNLLRTHFIRWEKQYCLSKKTSKRPQNRRKIDIFTSITWFYPALTGSKLNSHRLVNLNRKSLINRKNQMEPTQIHLICRFHFGSIYLLNRIVLPPFPHFT